MTIEDIINEYGTYVYHFALRLTVNEADAKNITQTTFINAWKGLNDLKSKKAVKQWLRVICYNEFKQLLKKKNKILIDNYETIESLENDARYYTDLNPSPIEESIMDEQIINLRNGCFLAMVKKLTLHQRIAFSLIDMFGLSINEVAQLLNKTPKAIKGLLYRARMNIDSFFNGHCYFLDINNPCRCEAWIKFMKDRNKFQEMMKQTKNILNYQDKNYVYDEAVRQKIYNYYSHMPFSKPDDEWFKKIIKIIEKKA